MPQARTPRRSKRPSPLLLAPGLGLTLLLPGACADDGAPTSGGALPLTCEARAIVADLARVAPEDVRVVLDAPADPRLAFVRADLEGYLSRLWGMPELRVDEGPPSFDRPHTVWVSSSEAARELVGGAPERGYALEALEHAGSRLVVAYAADTGELAHAAYALLEELGVRFFHPMQDVVPELGSPHLPSALEVRREPAFAMRGLHMHLLHPIEYWDALHEPGDEHFEEAKKLVDWLVRTGQNHLQWWIVNHPEPEAFRAHARRVIDYAHARGVTAGVAVQLWGGASYQNSYELVSTEENWQAELEAKLDELLELPWDVVDMGLGEFLAGDAGRIVDWLNHATAYVADNYPETELSVMNHVGDFPGIWVEYEGKTEYYYHLPKYADARLVNNVHTVFLFDLYRPFAGYGHDDFFLQREYMFDQLGKRTMRYIPESAYWVTADIDVPAFLPMYLVARHRDIQGLHADTRALGLPAVDGHVLYSSGHEWGYWMTDYLTAKMAWDPEAALSDHLADVARAFGSCAGDVERALSRLLELQTKYLFDERLIAYVSGEDMHDDLGELAGYVTTPRRIAFEDVMTMADDDRASFEAEVVERLGEAVRELGEVDELLGGACARPDATLGSFCRELVDGAAITRLRLDHSRSLYRAILAAARGADPASDLAAATATRERAKAVVERRAADYRFEASRLVEPWDNPTAYDFGYLRQAHTLCYWVRQAEQAAYLLETGFAAPVSVLPSCLD